LIPIGVNWSQGWNIGGGGCGATFTAVICPLVTFTAIREDAVAALTAIGSGADLNAVSLLLTVDGGWVGNASLGSVSRKSLGTLGWS